MIGDQPTGTIDSVVISAVAHEGLSITYHGKPARLAVVLDDGTVIAAGEEVAREARAVSVNCYRSLLKGKGHLRVLSVPIQPDT